jgi:hypothetical protein
MAIVVQYRIDEIRRVIIFIKWSITLTKFYAWYQSVGQDDKVFVSVLFGTMFRRVWLVVRTIVVSSMDILSFIRVYDVKVDHTKRNK